MRLANGELTLDWDTLSLEQDISVRLVEAAWIDNVLLMAYPGAGLVCSPRHGL